ncbi:ABC transporter ATP-binding protein/permease [Patescibacteria group bacterium]|nr:ABC transporter ATP-binding protein/permease [Patescibacteria group bacterium]
MKLVTKQTYQLFWQHIKKYRWYFYVIVFSIVIGSVVDVIVPIYYKKFIDLLTVSTAQNNLIKQDLVNILLLILGLNAVSWLFYRLATFTNNFFQPRVMAELQNTSFEYLHGHSFGFFVNRFVGGLVRKVGRLIRAFEEVTDAWYWNMIRIGVSLITVLVVVFSRYQLIGWLMLAWLALYLTINYYLSLYKLKLDEAAAAADTKVTSYLADTITNQSNLKIFAALSDEKKGFADTTSNQFVLSKKSWDFDAVIEAIQAVFMILLEFAIFYYCLTLWIKGLVTVGDFVLVQAYIMQVFFQLWGFGRIIRRMYRSFADAEEMVEILNTPQEIKDEPRSSELKVSKGLVEFKDVSFNYQNSLDVIKNFSLTVKPGEKVGIVGPSGAGKSTLVALLFRFYDSQQGAIYIDGQDIAKVSQESLRRNISLVPQDTILFHRTLLDNIRYGRRFSTNEEVIEVARQAHCDEFISRLPEGYNTFVGERGVKLSGGERQRVAIARAILKNAPILLLDEATSSLDSQVEILIQDALEKLMHGKTTIVIAHRLSTIMKMDRIVVVKNGMVEEIGSHAELLQKESGLYQTLWRLQAGGFVSA